MSYNERHELDHLRSVVEHQCEEIQYHETTISNLKIKVKNAKANEDTIRMLYKAAYDALQHAENELDEVYEERDIMHNALSKVNELASNEVEDEDVFEIRLHVSID